MDENFRKLEDILIKLKNVNDILEKETTQKGKPKNRIKKRGKSKGQGPSKIPTNYATQSKSIDEQSTKIKSFSKPKAPLKAREDTKLRKTQGSNKRGNNEKKLRSNDRKCVNPESSTAIVTRSSENHIILDFTVKPLCFPTDNNKSTKGFKRGKGNAKNNSPFHNKTKETTERTYTTSRDTKSNKKIFRKYGMKHHQMDMFPPLRIVEDPEMITFTPSFFSFHSSADDKTFTSTSRNKISGIDENRDQKNLDNVVEMVKSESLTETNLPLPLEAVNVTGSFDISDKFTSEITEENERKEKERVNIKLQFSSDKINIKDQNAISAPSSVDFLPEAKSEDNANHFLSLLSVINKETSYDDAGEKTREKVTLSSLTCSNNASSDPDIPRSGLAKETILSTSTSNDVLKKRQLSGGSVFYDCCSLFYNTDFDQTTESNQKQKQENQGFVPCTHANSFESNMTESRSEGFGRSGAKVNRKGVLTENINPSLYTYKRRESTSPDEGIANSPVEMDESPVSSRKDMLPEVVENNESQNHISIDIEGGLQREFKSRKRSSRQHKSSRRKVTTNVTSISPNEKERTVEKQEKDRSTQKDSSSRSTKKKSHNHKPMRLSEKTVARKVVKSAMIENSMARKNKPVWVEISKEGASGAIAEAASKRERNGHRHKEAHTTGATNGDKEIRKTAEKEDRKTSKRAHHSETSSKYNKREYGNRSSRHDKYSSRPDKTSSRKTKDRNGHLNKSDIKRMEAPRTLRHRNSETEKTTVRTRRRGSGRRPSRSNKDSQTQRLRSVSADSSVRDLSYSSSSSDSSSSSESYFSSTDSRTQSSESSYSTSSVSSSSALSSESSISFAQPNSLKKSGEYNETGVRPTKPKKKIVKSDERQVGKINADNNESKLQIHHSKYKRAEKKSSRRSPSYDADRKEYKALDLKPLQKATKDIEKTLGVDDDQEFEVNLERRRNGSRRRPVAMEEMVAKDPQKAQWQHHRLVTSQHPTKAAAVVQTSDKSKQITDPPSGMKQKSFEASTKDSSGAVLTIRDLYSLHHVLSDTQNGTVIAGHRRSDGMRVAIKRIAKAGTTRWGWMNGKVVPLELALICQVNEVRHPGVVEIVEWHETTEAFLLVMVRPHPSVDLYDHVTKQKRLKEPVARRIIRQLVSALLHCHKMGVLHRDVKLENILFNPITMDTILIDFGCGDYHRSGPYKEFAGTPEYYPPEWYLCKQYSGESATVWSIGVLMYSLLCGTLPFRSSKDIINKELTKYPIDVSRTAKHLIAQAVQKNPRDRLDLKGILSHPWFKSSSDHSGIRKKSV